MLNGKPIRECSNKVIIMHRILFNEHTLKVPEFYIINVTYLYVSFRNQSKTVLLISIELFILIYNCIITLQKIWIYLGKVPYCFTILLSFLYPYVVLCVITSVVLCAFTVHNKQIMNSKLCPTIPSGFTRFRQRFTLSCSLKNIFCRSYAYNKYGRSVRYQAPVSRNFSQDSQNPSRLPRY